MKGIEVELGQVLLTELDEDKFVLAQPDGQGAEAQVASEPTIHVAGFASRPHDPESGPDGQAIQGATGLALILSLGNEQHILFLEDPRQLALLGQWGLLEKGSSVQSAHRLTKLKSYDHHDGETGSKEIVVQYPGGQHRLKFSGDGSSIELETSGSLSATVSGGATINGAKVTAAGDVITASGVSLQSHMTPSPFGPLGPPTPTPSP